MNVTESEKPGNAEEERRQAERELQEEADALAVAFNERHLSSDGYTQ